MTEFVEVLLHGADAPQYAHAGDAGADLLSTDEVVISPGARVIVGTGVSIALPDGFVAFVVPRSGLAAKHGVTLVNTPGTIDAGYRHLLDALQGADSATDAIERARRVALARPAADDDALFVAVRLNSAAAPA